MYLQVFIPWEILCARSWNIKRTHTKYIILQWCRYIDQKLFLLLRFLSIFMIGRYRKGIAQKLIWQLFAKTQQSSFRVYSSLNVAAELFFPHFCYTWMFASMFINSTKFDIWYTYCKKKIIMYFIKGHYNVYIYIYINVFTCVRIISILCTSWPVLDAITRNLAQNTFTIRKSINYFSVCIVF